MDNKIRYFQHLSNSMLLLQIEIQKDYLEKCRRRAENALNRNMLIDDQRLVEESEEHLFVLNTEARQRGIMEHS
jgi:hypothetical protein